MQTDCPGPSRCCRWISEAALAEDQFFLLYQPIFDLEARR